MVSQDRSRNMKIPETFALSPVCFNPDAIKMECKNSQTDANIHKHNLKKCVKRQYFVNFTINLHFPLILFKHFYCRQPQILTQAIQIPYQLLIITNSFHGKKESGDSSQVDNGSKGNATGGK